MKKILVVCDGNEAAQVLGHLIRAGLKVEWAGDKKDAISQIKEPGDFDCIVLHLDNGLAHADAVAAALKMEARNMPIIIVAQQGVLDDGAGAGIALGNIDRVIPMFTAEVVVGALEQLWNKKE